MELVKIVFVTCYLKVIEMDEELKQSLLESLAVLKESQTEFNRLMFVFNQLVNNDKSLDIQDNKDFIEIFERIVFGLHDLKYEIGDEFDDLYNLLEVQRN